MRVPVRFFASRRILEDALGDRSVEQALNAATLPGLVGHVAVMPDVHQGYGFPIGGVAATHYPDGVISPGGIGYDINCGVRLLASTIPLETGRACLADLAQALDHNCPSGVGVKGGRMLTAGELEQVCRQGAGWVVKQGYGDSVDLARTESGGCLEGADPAKLSQQARERGRSQLGSLGAGNHFIEIDVVDAILDAKTAAAFGLFEGCLALQIHSGSRGLGHQVCSDTVQTFQTVIKRYNIQLPDRELVSAPLGSPEGKTYLAAMHCAANYAFANRQMLSALARMAFEETMAGRATNPHLRLVYDIAHNLGSLETHEIDGRKMKVCVHRKGATRAFGPGNPELPDEYRVSGQPVLVPGSMGTESWVLAGAPRAMQVSFGSCCHGAGRVMSRSQAKRALRGEQLKRELEGRGIFIRAGSMGGLAEEAPAAYKDVSEVVKVVVEAGLAKKVALLKPLVVIKG
ncbi:MAG: RtcB family protein [Anaerolineaceae bacterium]|nr:RtcB family protein [Anaerolineaceae bacterium]